MMPRVMMPRVKVPRVTIERAHCSRQWGEGKSKVPIGSQPIPNYNSAVSARLHAEAVLHALTGLRFGHPVYLYGQVGSTNAVAKQLAEAGAPEGLLVLAETQTAGRGRAGRAWITPAGTALALSLLLRPKLPLAQVTRLMMLAGVSVCEAIEQETGLRPALKWPNDVLIASKKAGGILIESGLAGDHLDYAVVGIGLNVSEAPVLGALDFPAAALQSVAGRAVDRLRLLRALLQQLADSYADLAAPESGQLYAAWSARLAWLGERVVAYESEGEIQGTLDGADADGALRVRLDSGEIRRVLAGDVSLRKEVAHV